jgi:hypothetical protein
MPSYTPTTAPSGWHASDYGYVAMAFDPAAFSTTSTPLSANGTLWFTRVILRRRALVTNIVLDILTAGATLTANQNGAALYNAAGTLLSNTAMTQSTNWTTTGPKVIPLLTAQDCAPGFYDIAFFANGTTRPAFIRAQGDEKANLGLTTTAIRYGSANTAQTTTFPATLGTKTAAQPLYWAALS